MKNAIQTTESKYYLDGEIILRLKNFNDIK